MAFNPFHSFRKHQKVIFAVLTILCMFVFVLQFGRGDMFERMAGLFGASRGKGEVVATLYGQKVTISELTGSNGLSVATQRRMASEFVEALRHSMIEAVTNDPRALSDKVDGRLRMAIMFLSQSPESLRQRMQANGFQKLFQDMTAAEQQVQSLQNELKNKPGKEDELKFADEVAEALKIQQSTMIFGGESGTYFGAGSTLQDMLDFKLWEHQAEKLGIVLTEGAVHTLLMKETGGRDMLPEHSFKVNDKSRSALVAFFKKYAAFSEKQIFESVAAEYRVILAQQVLLGQTERYRGGDFREDRLPVTITPGEFLQYFREQRTTVKVAVLPISVENFEKSVPEPTDEAVLLELFNEYKNIVPSPAQADPGFKEPRSVRVQYLIANAKDDYYQDMAKKFFVPSTAMTDVKLALARQVLAGCGAASGGGGSANWLSIATPLASDYVLDEYGKYSQAMMKGANPGGEFKTSPTGTNIAPDIYDPSYDAVSALGHILSGLAQGNPAAAPAALTNTNRAHAQTQARGVGAAIMTATALTPGSSATLQATTTHWQTMDKIDAHLVDKARKTVAQVFLIQNLRLFFKEMTELRSSPAKAKEYIEKATKDYHFRLETMSTAKNELSIAEDPALKDLRAAFAERRPPITVPAEFASAMFTPSGVYQLFSPPRFNGDQPQPFIVDLPEQLFVYWLAEDNQEKVRKFADAKPDVIKAWKRLQARKIAIKKAKTIEAEVQKRQDKWPTDFTGREDAVEAFLKEQSKELNKDQTKEQKVGQPFVLANVARQVEKDSANPGLRKEYEAYTAPKDLIQYPPEKLIDQLLSLEKSGDATWMQDRPKTTLYVAVLLERTVPKYNDFLQAYQNSLSDTLWTEFVKKERDNFKTKFMENMRTEAAPTNTENGKWKLPTNLQKRGSADDSE